MFHSMRPKGKGTLKVLSISEFKKGHVIPRRTQDFTVRLELPTNIAY